MDYLFMGIAAVIILIAILYFKKLYFPKKTPSKPQANKNGPNFVKCPVCDSYLLPGQNIYSKVFRPSNQVNDQLCYIYGCPNCYPVCKPELSRICPVCHKKVAQDAYLLSRMFNKTKSGKPHVIVNGCGNCNRHK